MYGPLTDRVLLWFMKSLFDDLMHAYMLVIYLEIIEFMNKYKIVWSWEILVNVIG